MRTSHGVVQGYNSQALIDAKHQVILHAEAFGRGQDHAHGPPMLDGALENLKSLGHSEDYFAGKIFTADTNYHSETNIQKCQELRLDAYIPDLYFRRRDPRYATQQPYWPRRKTFSLEDFSYDEAPDQYVCPNGKRLKRKVRYILRDGLVQRGYIADEQDCQTCPLRPRCLTARGGQTEISMGHHWGGTHQSIQENGRQDRHRARTKDLPAKIRRSRTGFCQHPDSKALGPFYPPGQNQSKYPVVAVLHDP